MAHYTLKQVAKMLPNGATIEKDISIIVATAPDGMVWSATGTKTVVAQWRNSANDTFVRDALSSIVDDISHGVEAGESVDTDDSDGE